MLLLAFSRGVTTTRDLHWAADADFDRDISYVQGTLDGHFGDDPSYAGEYLWYNPLLFSVETLLVKATGLPINDVVTRAGAYLNLLGPAAFFTMAALLLGFEIALASTLAFLFLSSGNIPGWGAATYSPWLYPVCFAQWMFYIGILLCYKAFSTGKLSWFAALGAITGTLFLGHAAPTVILVLLIAILQAGNILDALRKKEGRLATRHITHSLITAATFLITSLPLTWYVVGKYHLHSINRETFEYTEGIFIPKNLPAMIRANLSVALLISIIGFAWFWKNTVDTLLRKILLGWIGLALFLYCYSTLVAQLDWKYHIHLPGTVPSFHYFFYLKAAQSVFFGFGFIYLFRLAMRRLAPSASPATSAITLGSIVIACCIAYYPFYRDRDDFTALRKAALYKEQQKDKVDAYNYIVSHVPAEGVILCPADSSSLFPVMATGRKMVSTAFTFSNPYVDFIRRESDRLNMVHYLCTGEPASARATFQQYKVHYALVPNNLTGDAPLRVPARKLHSNDTYTLYSLNIDTTYSADRIAPPRSKDKTKL